jgi:hypothetical protein
MAVVPHTVLKPTAGRRWACDGVHDPALVAQMPALAGGRVHGLFAVLHAG